MKSALNEFLSMLYGIVNYRESNVQKISRIYLYRIVEPTHRFVNTYTSLWTHPELNF
jgi:hypothetical protein